MAVTSLAQRLVLGFRGGIALRCDARPVVDGIAEPGVTGVSADDHTALAGSLRDRSDPAQRTQSGVLSPLECIPSLREQRGERDPSDAWQGVEDHGVTLLDALPRCRLLAVGSLGHGLGCGEGTDQAIELGLSLHELAVDQSNAIDQGADVCRCGVGRARRHGDRRGAQYREHARRIGLADAVVFQHPRDRTRAYARGLLGCRHGRPQVEKPRRCDIAFDGQHLRKVAPQLLSHAVGEPRALGREVFRDARPLAQLDHGWVGEGELAKGMRVGSQGRRHGLGVAAVVLGARHREAIPEAVELLWVDCVDDEAALKQRLDDRPVRNFDADRDLARRGACRRDQPRTHLIETFAAVQEDLVAEPLAGAVGQPNVVLLRCPIDTGVELQLLHKYLQAGWRACTTVVDPCTGAPPKGGRGLPTGPLVVATRQGTGPPQVLKPQGSAQGAIGCSRRDGSDADASVIRIKRPVVADATFRYASLRISNDRHHLQRQRPWKKGTGGDNADQTACNPRS